MPPIVIPVSTIDELVAAVQNATGPTVVSIEADFSGNRTMTLAFDLTILGNRHVLTSNLTFQGSASLTVIDLNILRGCLHTSNLTGGLTLGGNVSILVSNEFLDGITATELTVLPGASVIADGGESGANGALINGNATMGLGAKFTGIGGPGNGIGLQVNGVLDIQAGARVAGLGGNVLSGTGNGGHGINAGSMTLAAGTVITARAGNGGTQGGNGILLGTLAAPGDLTISPGPAPQIFAMGGNKTGTAPQPNGNGMVFRLASAATIVGDLRTAVNHTPAITGGGPGGFIAYNATGGAVLTVLGMPQPNPIDSYFGNGVNAPENIVFATQATGFTVSPTAIAIDCTATQTVTLTPIPPVGALFQNTFFHVVDEAVATVTPAPGGLSAQVQGIAAGQTQLTIAMLLLDGTIVTQQVPITVTCGEPPPPPPPPPPFPPFPPTPDFPCECSCPCTDDGLRDDITPPPLRWLAWPLNNPQTRTPPRFFPWQ